MCIYCLYVYILFICVYIVYILHVYLVCFNGSIIFASGFQCSILCLECAAFNAVSYAWNVQLSMQYPMLGMCSFQCSILCLECAAFNAVSYAWNVQLSKQYLMLWAVIKVGDCQERILISGSSTEVH